jgi:Ca2+-binding EF-hand superfamily protein
MISREWRGLSGAGLALLAVGFGLALAPAAAPPREDVQDLVFLAEAERVPSVGQIRNGGLNFGGNPGGGRPTLAALDSDKDGRVTLAELAAYYRKNGLAPFQTHLDTGGANLGGLALFSRGFEPTVEAVSAAIFTRLDADGDGKLFEKEVLAYPDQYEKIQARATASCASLVLKDVSRGLFDLLDTNRDGRLSVREMRGAVGLLKRFDGGKGHLTRADIPRSHQLTLRRGPGGDLGEAQAFAGNRQAKGTHLGKQTGPTGVQGSTCRGCPVGAGSRPCSCSLGAFLLLSGRRVKRRRALLASNPTQG